MRMVSLREHRETARRTLGQFGSQSVAQAAQSPAVHIIEVHEPRAGQRRHPRQIAVCRDRRSHRVVVSMRASGARHPRGSCAGVSSGKEGDRDGGGSRACDQRPPAVARRNPCMAEGLPRVRRIVAVPLLPAPASRAERQPCRQDARPHDGLELADALTTGVGVHRPRGQRAAARLDRRCRRGAGSSRPSQKSGTGGSSVGCEPIRWGRGYGGGPVHAAWRHAALRGPAAATRSSTHAGAG